MNRFLSSTVNAINRHGNACTYTSVSASVYNIETGTSTPTSVDFQVTMYLKQIRATQYNYPNLIGKDSVMFYLANNSLGFIPKPNDKIVVDSEVWIVDSVIEHRARGMVALYKIIGIKA